MPDRQISSLSEAEQESLAQVDTALGPSHYGKLMQEAVEARAERLLQEALARRGWTKAQLRARLKGDPHKVQIARELRARTTMPLAWIAAQLHMGSRGYLVWLLQRPAAAASGNAQGLLGI